MFTVPADFVDSICLISAALGIQHLTRFAELSGKFRQGGEEYYNKSQHIVFQFANGQHKSTERIPYRSMEPESMLGPVVDSKYTLRKHMIFEDLKTNEEIDYLQFERIQASNGLLALTLNSSNICGKWLDLFSSWVNVSRLCISDCHNDSASKLLSHFVKNRQLSSLQLYEKNVLKENFDLCIGLLKQPQFDSLTVPYDATVISVFVKMPRAKYSHWKRVVVLGCVGESLLSKFGMPDVCPREEKNFITNYYPCAALLVKYENSLGSKGMPVDKFMEAVEQTIFFKCFRS
ncbi:hypothetical protein L596_021629 [Steinernema carpocapsae]|uniref:Uncharacterized protein n=1 Tax=Steinernema carpocapsae TaxID=34508 RepID=A0A4U5MJN1_STECR|nr:hypothetical protein L596_021629 [Steinernema carpocapsae]